ncbi:hypothetical protein MNBD_GAMMA09-270 [hydrothermal vent metagenome]|uniref:Smr domain-containing protein n=1 Tax=hydrothermal vent metagenome TaxID=652676 RepID=A0A3B0Y0V8_9ZZZZ
MKEDEKGSIFNQAMQDVTPITSDRANLKQKPGTIKKRPQVTEQKIKDTLSDGFIPECEDFLEFMRPGVQKSYMKQIRTGKVPIDDHIDLHGYRRDDARNILLRFLDHAQQSSYRLVRVVHGKGYHSGNGQPVLKAMVNKWLQNIPQVLAFVSTRAEDGGTGAVYVLLKKNTAD